LFGCLRIVALLGASFLSFLPAVFVGNSPIHNPEIVSPAPTCALVMSAIPAPYVLPGGSSDIIGTSFADFITGMTGVPPAGWGKGRRGFMANFGLGPEFCCCFDSFV
jgi:hypothetical protein